MEWAFWRPVLNKILTFQEASNASYEDIIDANAALDIKIEQEKIAIEKAKKEAKQKNGSG